MNMLYANKVNFDYCFMLVQRIAKIKNRDCYLELCECLAKNKVDYTINSNWLFFNITALSQNTR